MIGTIIAGSVSVIFLASGIRVVRPTHKLLIETLGKYKKTAEQGFSWIVPLIQSGRFVNITEQMVDVKPQTVITKDNLNAVVDAVVYYQIADVKKSQYNVDSHKMQLASLARTTLRAVIGNMTFTQANESREQINERVAKILDKETDSYGVTVLRVELQKIEAPREVQVAMNEVVIAERKKISAENFALAKEIEADGDKKASIKKAEGKKRASILESEGMKESSILEAQGKSEAFKLIEKEFKGNAQLLKKLEVTENSLKNNSKIILTEKGINPQLLIGELPLSK
jgi:regulator of protease activity HflC (stomatin/prohibitin superfamily)